MNHLQLPLRLVSNETKNQVMKPNTHVRFVTSTKSNSGISYPYSGVRVAFLDTNQQACDMHYIQRYSSSTRFETGYIDDVELYTPLQSIHQLWLFPEEGTWNVDKVHVHHDHKNMSTFEVNRVIGTDEYPAILLHKQKNTFDTTKYEQAIREYDTLKIKLLQTNLYLVAMGSLTYVGVMDFESFRSFTAGGFLGLFYLFLLEQNTNIIGSSSKWYLGPLVSGPIRLFIVTYISIKYITSDDALILPYTIGFFMYKLAVYLTIIFQLEESDEK